MENEHLCVLLMWQGLSLHKTCRFTTERAYEKILSTKEQSISHFVLYELRAAKLTTLPQLFSSFNKWVNVGGYGIADQPPNENVCELWFC